MNGKLISGVNGGDASVPVSMSSNNKGNGNNQVPYRPMAVVTLQNASNAINRNTATLLRTSGGQVFVLQNNVAVPVQINSNFSIASIASSSTSSVPPDPVPPSISIIRHPTPPPPAPAPTAIIRQNSASDNGRGTPLTIHFTSANVTTPIVGSTVVVSSSAPISRIVQPSQQLQQPAQQQSQPTVNLAEANKRKCIQFLKTLLKVAKDKNDNDLMIQISDLVSRLLGNRITAQLFTEKIQAVLNSKPQPNLLPFLENILPTVRTAFFAGEFTLDGIDQALVSGIAPTPTSRLLPAVRPTFPSTVTHQPAPIPGPYIVASPTSYLRPPPPNSGISTTGQPFRNSPRQQYPALAQQLTLSRSSPDASPSTSLSDISGQFLVKAEPPTSPPAKPKSSATTGKKSPGFNGGATLKNASGTSGQKSAKSYQKSGQNALQPPSTPERYREPEDDINDVAAMGGVNLSEETQQILASTAELLSVETRSYDKEENFLRMAPLLSKVRSLCVARGLATDPTPEALKLISQATQERLKHMLEQLSILAEHRTEAMRNNPIYEQTSDVRAQVRFLDQLAQADLKKKEEREKVMVMKMAKSRSTKLGDVEQQRMKELAKELQKADQNEKLNRDANAAAQLALASSRKRPAPGSATGKGPTNDNQSSMDGMSGTPSQSGVGPVNQVNRPRYKRVSLRDLHVLQSQDRWCRSAETFYRSFFK